MKPKTPRELVTFVYRHNGYLFHRARKWRIVYRDGNGQYVRVHGKRKPLLAIDRDLICYLDTQDTVAPGGLVEVSEGGA